VATYKMSHRNTNGSYKFSWPRNVPASVTRIFPLRLSMLFLVKSSPVFLANSVYYQYEILQGKLTHSEKNSVVLPPEFTTNPTWTAMGAIPGLAVGSRRLTVPSPQALRYEKYSTRKSSVIKFEYLKNSPSPASLQVQYLLKTNSQLKNKAQIPRSAEPLCCSKVYNCLPTTSKTFNTTRLQRKSGRSQYTD